MSRHPSWRGLIRAIAATHRLRLTPRPLAFNLSFSQTIVLISVLMLSSTCNGHAASNGKECDVTPSGIAATVPVARRAPYGRVPVPQPAGHRRKRVDRPRLAILTDIGGDPDDQQSLIRLMLYANEFEIEVLMASASGTPGELNKAVTRPDLILEIVDAYGKVLPNLKTHAAGWPSADDLRKRVKSGNPHRGLKYIGEGHDTEASREIIRLVDAGTKQRPLNLAIWGGQTDLAQALFAVKRRRSAGLATFVSKLCVYDIADQDGIATWIHDQFPGLNYILNKAPPTLDKRKATFRGMYLTGDESLTSREWIEAHVRSKGPLGALYPIKTWTAPNQHSCLKEGDTPSWFFFLPLGGNDPADPTKAGWGGRFRKSEDGWSRDLMITDSFDPRETVSRFRSEFQADFAKRMRWCVE